eukprot:6298629-Alexandrium_andersonii.AAC.1
MKLIGASMSSGVAPSAPCASCHGSGWRSILGAARKLLGSRSKLLEAARPATTSRGAQSV